MQAGSRGIRVATLAVVLSAILANAESGTGTFGMVATVFVSITAPSVNALGPH